MPLYTDDHKRSLADAILDRMNGDLSMTFAKIAEASGLNDRTIRKIVSGRVDPRSATLTDLEIGLRSLGIEPSTKVVRSDQEGNDVACSHGSGATSSSSS